MTGFYANAEAETGAALEADATLPIGDTTGPVMQGAISFTKTATTTDIAWPAATDAVGVAEYFVAKDGAAAVSTGLTRAASFSGLAPQSTHQYVVTARDAAGNLSSNSLTVQVTTSAASGGRPAVPASRTVNFPAAPSRVNFPATPNRVNF